MQWLEPMPVRDRMHRDPVVVRADAPITPARSPSAAGSTGHWYHGAKAGKLASA